MRSAISAAPTSWSTATLLVTGTNDIGPAVVDVGHNRLNLFFYDAALAELFTTTCETAAEADYYQRADISAIIGGLDNLRSNPPPQRARHAIENALAAAIAAGI